MAGLGHEITIKSELRPAVVTFRDMTDRELPKLVEQKVLVHEGVMANNDCRWCEYPDGTMHEIGQGLIRYLDSRGRFDEICWEVPVR